MSKKAMWAEVLIFLLFIGGFFVANMLSPQRTFSEQENRVLQTMPKFTFERLFNKEFTSEFEDFASDQFIWRDEWITLKAASELALGKQENNDVSYGKDQTLIEAFNAPEQSTLNTNMSYVNALVENTDANVYFALIPGKSEIWSDKLPSRTPNDSEAELIEYCYGLSNANNVDMLGALREHADEYIYYRTDHHWTTLGAYYAYAQLMQQLGQEPVALSELDGKTVENFYGTYFSKAKKFDAQADTITYYEIPDAGVTIDGKEQDGYYDFSKFEVRDKYAAFLRGNNGYTVIKSGVRTVEEGQEPSRILIIKDSYANSFAPFLLYNYDEVHVVDLRYLAGSLSQLINEGGFDEILLMYNFSNLVTDTNLYKLGY